MKNYYTYDKQEAEDFKQYLEAQGRKVRIVPIAEDFRKIGDTRMEYIENCLQKFVLIL